MTHYIGGGDPSASGDTLYRGGGQIRVGDPSARGDKLYRGGDDIRDGVLKLGAFPEFPETRDLVLIQSSSFLTSDLSPMKH